MALTDKQEAFVQWLIKGKSQREAYKLAGYKTDTMADAVIDVKACELLKSGKVAVRHEELRSRIIKEAEDECIISVKDVLREYKKLGFFDPRKLFDDDGKPIPINQLDDDTAAAIAGLDVLEEYEGHGEERTFIGYTKKYKITDKKGALDSIAKHLGMFVERVDHTLTDLSQLTPEERRARIDELNRKRGDRVIDAPATRGATPD